MSTPAPPKLTLHHGYKSWTSQWWASKGKRKSKRFGKQGDVTAKQARARYDKWLETQWKRFERAHEVDDSVPYTCGELALDFTAHARTVYQKNGKTTTHIWQVAYAMDALNEHYGSTAAAALEAPQLASLRDAMVMGVDQKGKPKARALKTVNGRLFCIKQAFGWARERGLVPRETVADLLLVKPLMRGRSKATDPIPVRPVDEATVRATMAQCPKAIAVMIELQWHTGMRPGEVCIMRMCDIEMLKGVWIYRPHSHKTEHKGIDRWIVLGPKSQAIIKPFMTRALTAYLFQPGEVVAERLEAKHAKRKTPMNQGNKPGVRTKGTQVFADCYNDESYRKAIHWATVKAERAAHKANPDMADKILVPKWNPNQLRHSWATRVRESHGIEVASAGLGHANLSITEVYAERTMEKMIAVAKAIG